MDSICTDSQLFINKHYSFSPNKKTKPSEAAAQTVEKGCGGAAPPAGAEAEEEDEDQEKEKEKEKASEASSLGVLAKYRSRSCVCA